MENSVITQEAFLEALKVLVTEAYRGPANPSGTWFVDNEPDSGFIGILDRVDSVVASAEQGYPSGGSIAAHAYHMRFALDLVVRASRGEPAFEHANWADSWVRTEVNETEWSDLRADLRRLVNELMASLVPGPQWSDPLVLTGSMAVMAHGAWHLGAIRQLAR